MVRSMVSSMVRSGWSVSSMSRLRVDRGSLVPHVGNESALMVSPVGDNLYAAIRERHPVLSGHNSVLVLDFFLGKVGPRVRVLNSVLVCERSGGNLGRSVSWSVVERSSVVRSMVRTVSWAYRTKLGGQPGKHP